MSTIYQAYITRIKNLRKHTNADRLLCGDCFGNTVIVDLSTQPEQLGIYFPTDGQLSIEYASINNLVRRKDEAGNNVGGYLDPDKRNIKALKLRGEKSDGLFMPLESLASFGDIGMLKEGDTIGNFNGHGICCKYIPVRQNTSGGGGIGNKTRKRKDPIAPLFAEHADTEQLAYNLSAFKSGDEIEITLKMHGTSGRTGYLPVFKGYKRNLWDRITRKTGKPIYDWGYVSGTRRVVLDDFEGGYYGSNSFREQHSKFFEGKLQKGETVYYEIVGFTDNGTPIMPACSNKKLNDKEFVKQYGEQTVFSYGCVPSGRVGVGITQDIVPKSDCYVYRMTMTNEDGYVVEYTPDFMRYRCEQMGAKTVPLFGKLIIPDYYILPDEAGSPTAGKYALKEAEVFYDGVDPIGKTHIREGVVVRIINRPKFCAYKHKNFSFKVLEGIIKETAEAPDIEEEQEIFQNEA